MKITKDKKYNQQLKTILEFIAKDSVANAVFFKKNLDDKIKDLPHIPYKFGIVKYKEGLS